MEADPAEADAESSGEGELTKEVARDMMDVDDVYSLADFADHLKARPIKPVAAEAIAEVIDELAGGHTATYINTTNAGINRVGVITDGFTVRVLMLTTSWKWRGPYTPEDPEGYLDEQGYVPAPEVSG